MRVAFKEWAIVVDALSRGDQIIILRKGGISEGRAGFQLEHPEFLLFPTRYHQQREQVIPSAQARYDGLWPTLPPEDRVCVSHFARVVEWRRLESLSDALRLRPFHIWRDEVIQDRFDWGRDKAIFAIVVRVFALSTPVSLPLVPAYGGCKSWIELGQEIDVTGAKPALGEARFAEVRRAWQQALATADAVPPAPA